MSSANTQTVHRVRNEDHTRPRAPADVVFKKIAFGLWRAETDSHRLEIRLDTGKRREARQTYHGQITRRHTIEIVTLATCSTTHFQDCQRKLVDALTLDREKAARIARPRAICTFEDFDDDGIEARLLRRRDVHLKRWNAVALSERFTTGRIDGRPTRILTVVTEEAAP